MQTKTKGGADNLIINTVLPHDIFLDWVWFLQGKVETNTDICFFSSSLSTILNEELWKQPKSEQDHFKSLLYALKIVLPASLFQFSEP